MKSMMSKGQIRLEVRSRKGQLDRKSDDYRMVQYVYNLRVRTDYL